MNDRIRSTANTIYSSVLAKLNLFLRREEKRFLRSLSLSFALALELSRTTDEPHVTPGRIRLIGRISGLFSMLHFCFGHEKARRMLNSGELKAERARCCLIANVTVFGGETDFFPPMCRGFIFVYSVEHGG